MRKARTQSSVLIAGILLSISWIAGTGAEATRNPSSQSHPASETKPASQPAMSNPIEISPLEKRLVDMLAAASMKLAQVRQKARELRPKAEAAIEKAKNSKPGQKITELARTTQTKAQELASRIRKTVASVGTQLEKAAEQTAARAEGMNTAVSSAKRKASSVKPQAPRSQPTDAHFKAIWRYRLLWTRQSLLELQAASEQAAATALKGVGTNRETSDNSQPKRAFPIKEVRSRKFD